LNYRIQGGAAGILKKAKDAVRKLIRGHENTIQIISEIHDELIFQIKKGNRHWVPIIKQVMELDHLSVPLVVDVQYSQTNWADKIDYPEKELNAWSLN